MVPIGRVRLIISLVAAAAVTAVLAAPAEAALRFERCGGYGYSCARLSVPLDRSGAVPGRVSLLVKRVRARQRGGATLPPLFVLAGGPGQSATQAFGGNSLGFLYPAYGRRDLIVFDQRGTGRSGLLRCPRLERANLLRAGPAAGACARSLGARRAFYTSRDTTDDIDAIRERIGAERIALFGTSYGTKVALGYAQRYPDRVERLVLDSVVELDGPDPYYLDAVAATPRALRSLCEGGSCRWTADPVADLAALVDRIVRTGPLRGRLVDARGRRRPGVLESVDLLTVLLGGDFDVTLRAAVPGAVSAALDGDAAPMLRLRRRAFEIDAEPPPPLLLSSAVYAATSCEEVPLPWARTTPPDPAERHRQAAAHAATIPDSAFEPFDRSTALASDTLDLCESWPHAPEAPAFGSGPMPDVPVLLVEGEDDLRTPVENAERTAGMFARSRLVVAEETGHSAIGSDFSGCALTAFAHFLQLRPVRSCREVPRAIEPPPPPPARLADVSPQRGTPGIRGRTLAAVNLTLDDVWDDSITRRVSHPRGSGIVGGGGLRAGRYRLSAGNTLELHGFSFVPGVTLTGRIEDFVIGRDRGRLRIGGRAASRGVLTVSFQRVSGRLGGRRVRADLNQQPSFAALSSRRAHWAQPPGTP